MLAEMTEDADAQFQPLTQTELARRLGVSRRTVGRARERGAVVALLPGVFTIAAQPVGFRTRAMAVQLYCGDGAYLTGTSSGSVLGLRAMPRNPIQAAVPRRFRWQLPRWATVNCATYHDPNHVVMRADGFRIADAHLTLESLAAQFNDHRFAQAAEDAWHRKLITPSSASSYLERNRGPGRPGVTRFGAWVAKTAGRPQPSQSGLEMTVIDAIGSAGMPDPQRQFPLELLTGEVVHLDIAWPDVKLAVEPGHSWWHGGDLQMRKDAARDRACGELGWHVVRYDETAAQDPAAVGHELARIHAIRRQQLRVGPV